MNASITAPSTVQIRRSRLLGLVAGVAVLAAGITWGLAAVAFDSGASTSNSGSRANVPTRISSAAADAAKDRSIMKLTPAQLAAGALGTGYQLPIAQGGPTRAAVLASMTPQTRRWTTAVTSLTFEQLAAGAAGRP